MTVKTEKPFIEMFSSPFQFDSISYHTLELSQLFFPNVLFLILAITIDLILRLIQISLMKLICDIVKLC
jgi:hypothetical protein